MSRFVLAALGALALASPAMADTVVCPPVIATGFPAEFELCRSIPQALDTAGMDRGSALQITNTNDLTLLGDETVDLNFKFIHDDGDYNFCFGYCMEDSIDATLLATVKAGTATEDQKFDFAVACMLTSGTKVFDDLSQNPPAETTIVNGAVLPASPVFFLLPNDHVSNFDSNGDAAARHAYWLLSSDKPIFSISGANPGNMDQLVLYTDSLRTLFMWEDISRTVIKTPTDDAGSDQDFGDLVFSLNYVLGETVEIVGSCDKDCTAKDSVYTQASAGQDYAVTLDSATNCLCSTFTCN